MFPHKGSAFLGRRSFESLMTVQMLSPETSPGAHTCRPHGNSGACLSSWPQLLKTLWPRKSFQAGRGPVPLPENQGRGLVGERQFIGAASCGAVSVGHRAAGSRGQLLAHPSCGASPREWANWTEAVFQHHMLSSIPGRLLTTPSGPLVKASRQSPWRHRTALVGTGGGLRGR